MGPSSIKARLARMAFLRVQLTVAILVLALAILGLALRTPSIMDTVLFVADGSAVGCMIPAFPTEGGPGPNGAEG